MNGEKNRVHHTYIWLGGARASLGFIVLIAVIGTSTFFEVAEDYPEVASHASMLAAGMLVAIFVLLLVAACGIAIGARAISYRFLWYELGPSELGIYSGIVSKRHTHIPYQKVQSVDQKASLVQRVFGVCNVVINTAGGSSNKAVVIPYLTKQAATNLRNELYARKIATSAAAEAARPGAAQVVAPAAFAQAASTAPTSPASGAMPAAMPQAAASFAPPAGAPVVAAAPAAPAAPAAATAPSSREENLLDVGAEAWEQFGGVFGGQEVALEAPSYEYGLSNKEILLTGISNSGALVGVMLIAALGAVQAISALGDIGSQAVNAAEDIVIGSLSSQAFDAIALAAGIGFLGLALFVWALAVGASCLQYGGFRARRRGTHIEVESGLLRHGSISLDIERVQSVIVKQTLIRRLMGYCEVSLGKMSAAEPGDSSGGQSAKGVTEAGFVIHPFVKADRVEEILRGMVPEYANLPSSEVRLAPAALRRGIIRRCILQGGGLWTAIVVAIIQAIVHLCADPLSQEGAEVLGVVDTIAFAIYGVAAVIFAFEVAATVMWFRNSRFALGKKMVAFTNGGFAKTTVSIPRMKVQFGCTRTNPLQSRAGTSTVSATTAAGVGGTRTSLIDVSADAAKAWLAWIEPGGSDARLPEAAPSTQ